MPHLPSARTCLLRPLQHLTHSLLPASRAPAASARRPHPGPRAPRPTATVLSGPRRPPPRPGAQNSAAPARGSAPSPRLSPPGPGARHRLPSQRARCSGPGSLSPVPAAPGPAPRRLPRSRRCAGSFPLLAGARLQHPAPLPQPAATAANPHLTHFPAGAGDFGKVSGGRSLLRLLRPGPGG